MGKILVKANFLQYNSIPKWITETNFYPVDEFCNSWIAINRGDCLVTVNGIPLKPPPAGTSSGETTGVSGNAGEIYAGSLNVQFPNGGANPSVLIVQKVYIPSIN